MKPFHHHSATIIAAFSTCALAQAEPEPLKALLIAGGCCHDYQAQQKILSEGISSRANIRVDVIWTKEGGHNPEFLIFKDPDWAKDYDVIIHDECAALKKDETELKNILNAHKTVPAVHLHCAMHSFRGSENDWAKHLGVKSDRHGPHVPITVEIVNPEHPITKPLKGWVSEKDELYNNVDIYGADPLALGTQTYRGKDGKEVTDSALVAWTNTKFGAPSFSTSLGHFNHNVEDPRYLELVTRGALWVCGKLDNQAYHQAYTGENSVLEIEEKHYNQKPKPNKKQPAK
ncbi:ThuA domain-containing protein [Rubritalea marina]|uniref:ThuA domain-containing protein n=1 Tax=Rubritalea marina TaxID=361055 RepID=UPI0003602023|nr:ThuA domain-containing protein [Rubritalea marina]